MNWEIVIGLEVHVQLKTQSKAFCGCKTTYGSPPNSQTCPVCLGYPGALPVLNREVVNSAIKAGLATHSKIRYRSGFARKNYFYPDLPKGYQISQYTDPICYDGYIQIPTEEGKKKIGLIRIHMEEDAGKSMHTENGTLIDLNRCGIPLLEIVSCPDIRSPQEAYTYLTTLKQIIRYTGISDCNMEEGSLRCDANLSVRPMGEKTLGTRTELKNMNSFHGVEKALAYEANRQITCLEAGEPIEQQTLLWNEQTQRAEPMRSKEESHDYRYFPEPDLVDVQLTDAWIQDIKAVMPELPEERLSRFIKHYGLSEEDSLVLTAEHEIADYFEAAVQGFQDISLMNHWIRGEILRILKEKQISIDQCPISPKALRDLLTYLLNKKITPQTAKTVLDNMVKTGESADKIIEKKGLLSITSSEELDALIRNIVEKHPEEVKKYRQGKTQLLGFFMGQVMKATKGRADQKITRHILQRYLDATEE
ncbi:MAG: Asp-tRNA(Asn)/Glu-tRNA(Gln) amidotransferase subunit GatB [Candidatus Marinimicrobia bacterium]|nr:Asp-tRNA(Asn)/Glu-tRNA(Gln) amidotransferase subunit GatB [Candidatus Neomarinimicrobiota bacterium]